MQRDLDSAVTCRWDVPYNLARLTGLIRQAAAADPPPDLVLAPEGLGAALLVGPCNALWSHCHRSWLRHCIFLRTSRILEGYPVMDVREGAVAADHIRAVAFTDESPPIVALRELAADTANAEALSSCCTPFKFCSDEGFSTGQNR